MQPGMISSDKQGYNIIVHAFLLHLVLSPHLYHHKSNIVVSISVPPQISKVLLCTPIPGNEDELYQFVDTIEEKEPARQRSPV